MTGERLKALLQDLNEQRYSDNVLAMWLTQVENSLLVDVLLLDPAECVEYEGLTDAPLLVPKPFDKLYLPYMQAQIAHANGEMEVYENYLQLYNAYRNEYARHICDVVRPAYGEAVQRGYFLSAYQLAVADGFEGSLQEWLASLEGAAGASAYQIAVAEGFEGTQEQWIASLRGAQGGDGYLDVTERWKAEVEASTLPEDDMDIEDWLLEWGKLGDGAYCARWKSGYYELRQETVGGVCYQTLRHYSGDGVPSVAYSIDGSRVLKLDIQDGHLRTNEAPVASERYVQEFVRDSALPMTEAAQVGQFLVVAEVDAAGKVAKMHAVNAPTGGGGVDEEQLTQAVEAALAQAKESGEFDGEDGYTPVKGKDYFTEADKSEMVQAVGADAAGTAAGKVSEHNASGQAHGDIRLLIQGLTDRLNALADSDDTTLDQMSELVAYIKSNKSLIDGITTGKVSVSDIVDNLTTSVANKPLSAKQGVALKALIDKIVVPTKVSQLTNDNGYLTAAPVTSVNGKKGAVVLSASDVGALPSTTVIPVIPDSLPANGGNADTVGGKTAAEIQRAAVDAVQSYVETAILGGAW